MRIPSKPFEPTTHEEAKKMNAMTLQNNISETPEPETKPDREKAGISIFGLGYVGAVSSACFADLGHQVIGVDPDDSKVALINAGDSPIVENGLPELLGEGVKNGLIKAINDVEKAVLNSSISLICVGTPSAPDGSCDLKYLKQVSSQIGAALRKKDEYHVIVFRSTIPPGTTRKVLLPIIERESGKRRGDDFGLCFHPEFLRESTAIEDFRNPPKTVIGSYDDRGGKVLAGLYEGVDDKVIHTTIEAAEMVKYVDNTWHAAKVSFANEIGKICRACGIDSHTVMDIFVQDTKLNISPYYLKPGFAFGGSCLPKDVRGINHLAQSLGIETPVLNSLIPSNQAQIGHALDLIERTGAKRVGFLGITFKSGTDDLRESPVLPVIAALMEKGIEVRFYDQNLNLDTSVRHHLQHSKHDQSSVDRLMAQLPGMACESAEQLCSGSDTIVISHNDPNFREAATARANDQYVVDLARVFEGRDSKAEIFNAHMNDYLQKPARSEQVLGTLKRWTRKEEGQSARVLLAEDDPVMRMVTKAVLEKAGHSIDTAENGKEALQAVSKRSYDIVFMDLAMPGMGGLEAATHIRALPGNKGSVPIIAMTAHAEPEKSSTYEGICW